MLMMNCIAKTSEEFCCRYPTENLIMHCTVALCTSVRPERTSHG